MGKLLFCFFILLGLLSCENKGNNRSKNYIIDIVLPGLKNDKSWSEAGYEGGELISKNLNSNVRYYENVTQTKSEDFLQKLANAKPDLIIAHGSEYLDSIKKVAEKNLQTKFVITTKYSGNNKNLAAAHFKNIETIYLLSYVASIKSKTKKIAFLAGEKTESTEEIARNLIKFSKERNPDIEVLISYVGSWSDINMAMTNAKKLIEQKADFIFVCLDSSGDDVHKLAQENKINTIGWTKDKYSVAPNAVITSVIEHTPVSLFEIVKLARSGHLEGKLYRFGFREGAVTLSPFRGALKQDEEERFNQIKSDVFAGKIKFEN